MIYIFLTVFPGSYILNANPVSRNGSSENGNCSSLFVRALGYGQGCDTPHTSVLFDGIIPSLTGINNNMCWAQQLLTLTRGTAILFDFTTTTNVNGQVVSYNGIGAIEIVMFNCPSRSIGADAIIFQDPSSGISILTIALNRLTSCDHLVRSCISPSNAINNNMIAMFFISPQDFIYLAEVTFYAGARDCSSAGIITTSTTSAPPTCSSPTEIYTVTPTNHSSTATMSVIIKNTGMNTTTFKIHTLEHNMAYYSIKLCLTSACYATKVECFIQYLLYIPFSAI